MKINNQSTKIGLVMVVVSVFILGLLLILKLQTDGQMLAACAQSCGEAGGEAGAGTNSASCNLNSCPYHQNNYLSWILLVISILVAFIGGTGIYLLLSPSLSPSKKNGTIIEEKQYDLSRLSEEDKNIFLFIKEHHSGVYQSHLVKEFNLSKVQATRLLDKLEGWELIERKRRGLTNLVNVK